MQPLAGTHQWMVAASQFHVGPWDKWPANSWNKRSAADSLATKPDKPTQSREPLRWPNDFVAMVRAHIESASMQCSEWHPNYTESLARESAEMRAQPTPTQGRQSIASVPPWHWLTVRPTARHSGHRSNLVDLLPTVGSAAMALAELGHSIGFDPENYQQR